NFDNLFNEYTAGNEQWEGNDYKGEFAESEKETKIIDLAFNKRKPYLAINCHTTTGNGNGVDMNAKYPQYKILTKDIHNSLKLTYPEAGTLEWNGQFSPSAQGWYGKQQSKEGTNVITTILEHQSDTTKYNIAYTTLSIIAVAVINYNNNNHLKSNKL